MTPAASLAGRTRRLADGIALFLDQTLARHGVLPGRSFYGESFTALLLGLAGVSYAGAVARLGELYRGKDKEDPGFHWEFNKYAWCLLYRETGNEMAREFALPLRFMNTAVTNWILLRSCTRLLARTETAEATREAASVLRRFQSPSGLICDQPNVRSFQYHCFSAVMAAEIFALSGDPFFLDRFRRAAEFSERFVLRTGDALYVGRGQQQSFGYGALVCLLAVACQRFGASRHLASLSRSLSFLEGFRRPDGSFPLVLNGTEQGYPPASSASDPRYPGWYAYNNYFDYLPFLGVFLRKAADALEGVRALESPARPHDSRYRDPDFLVVRKARYEAVLARPGGGWKGGDGYWTNDLPFPYVVCDGMRVTPSYGGEQFGSALYTPAGVPLPAVLRRGRRRPLRDGRVWSFFVGDRLVFLSLRGALSRHFRFLEDQIIVEDRQLGAGRVFARYLFDGVRKLDDRTFAVRGGARVHFSLPMEIESSREFYWGGPLTALVASKSSVRCTVRLHLGDPV